MATVKQPIGREIVYLTDFDEETDKLEKNWGFTNRYSFGDVALDTYFSGGFGRQNGYEIVLLFGDTGIGKSTFGLNMILDPILKGANVGLLMLEDDGADVNGKLRRMLGRDVLRQHRQQIHFTPSEVVSGKKLWGLEDLLDLIESWFVERKMDIILLDHLQFAFESAVSLKGENEYNEQRVFVRKLNYLVRTYNKTIIMVSHVNKNAGAKGMQKVMGSAGIAGSATKTIEIRKDGDTSGVMLARLWKSRFTSTPDHDRAFRYDANQKIIGPNLI
jgi:predicted ATP-dependent serine protease